MYACSARSYLPYSISVMSCCKAHNLERHKKYIRYRSTINYGIVTLTISSSRLDLASLYKQLANFQCSMSSLLQARFYLASFTCTRHLQCGLGSRLGFIVHWSLRGQSNISSTPCPRSFSPFYHPSTLTRLPDTGSPQRRYANVKRSLIKRARGLMFYM